jgi:hypothetical protein
MRRTLQVVVVARRCWTTFRSWIDSYADTRWQLEMDGPEVEDEGGVLEWLIRVYIGSGGSEPIDDICSVEEERRVRRSSQTCGRWPLLRWFAGQPMQCKLRIVY